MPFPKINYRISINFSLISYITTEYPIEVKPSFFRESFLGLFYNWFNKTQLTTPKMMTMNSHKHNLRRNAFSTVFILLLMLVTIQVNAQTTPSISFTTTATGSFNFAIKTIKESTPIMVDWGDGKQLSYIIGTDSTAVSSPVAFVDTTTISIYGSDIIYLNVNNKKISSMDVTNCPTLESLYCSKNEIELLIVNKNPELKYLYCDQNYLWNKFDLKQNTKLLELSCRSNYFYYNLDISGNTLLSMLDCKKCYLTELDVSKNNLLTKLDCSSNQLKDLDVSKNTLLSELFCSANLLTNLDVSGSSFLTEIQCSKNQLISLDLSKNLELKKVDCADNELTFKTLPSPKSTYTQYVYSPQAIISMIPSIIKSGDIVDFSNQAAAKDVNGILQKTDFVWKNAKNEILKAGTDYTIPSPGKFGFQNEPVNVVFCEMKNQAFPNFKDENILRTKPIQPEGLALPLAISMTASTKTISFKLKALSEYTPIKIDNGKGEFIYITIGRNWTTQRVVCNSTGDTSIKIYGNDITSFNCNFCGLTKLNIDGATSLIDLDCSSNSLSNINISKNLAINSFKCSFNNITSLYIDKNVILNQINCGYNKLSWLDVTKNTSLSSLFCSSNTLTIIDISRNVNLDTLVCSGNKLTNIDLTKNLKLKFLDCGYNNIKSLDLDKNQYLEYLNCSHNSFELYNLPKRKASYKTYIYAPQRIYYRNTILVGETIDLSYLLNIPDIDGKLQTTNYIWRFGDKNLVEGIDYRVVSPGKFMFLKVPSTLFTCEMTNIAFPDFKDRNTMKFNCYMNPAITINANCLKSFFFKIGSNSKYNMLIINDGANSYYSQDEYNYMGERSYPYPIKIYGTGLTELEIDYTTELKTLSLTTDNAPLLSKLNCYGNRNLVSLSIDKNNTLQEINCYGNNLSSLDVTKCNALTKLSCYSNKLAQLDVTKNTLLAELNCYGNALNFATLPQEKTQFAQYQYAPQFAFQIPKSIVKGKPIDLSTQLSAKDVNLSQQTTIYQWKTKAGNTLTENIDFKVSEAGKFIFLAIPTDSVYCQMSNTAFPNFKEMNTYKTTCAKISTSTGIEDQILAQNVLIYSSGSIVYVRFPDFPKNTEINISDITGRSIISKIANNVLTTIPISKRGVYLVAVVDGNTRKVGKVVISKSN